MAKKAADENLKRDDVVTIVDAIKEFPQKTEHILSETYPPKHDDMVRTMDRVTGKGKKLATVPLTDEEKIRNWARDLSAKLNDALELMYSLPVKKLNPHTLAMLYDQTIRLPAFILNFYDKVVKFNERVEKTLHSKTLETVDFKELKGES